MHPASFFWVGGRDTSCPQYRTGLGEEDWFALRNNHVQVSATTPNIPLSVHLATENKYGPQIEFAGGKVVSEGRHYAVLRYQPIHNALKPTPWQAPLMQSPG